ncbi:MAG: alpha/beta hydrolase [Flavisolibacter sp.]
MVTDDLQNLVVEQRAIASRFLKRYVIVDFYLPKNAPPGKLSLLLINDGQDLDEMPFAGMMDEMLESGQVQPVLCAGIHAGKERKLEYGTASVLDYEKRGSRSADYNRFILEELVPFIHNSFSVNHFRQKAFAGFSLGGLTAMDMTWHYPDVFTTAGIFSGSLWWRSKSLEDHYNDATDRIMHQLVRKGTHRPGLRFYFTTGSQDETADRNHNGIIDSIDDTLDLIEELEQHGYNRKEDVHYINFEDGRHDVATWGKAMPGFLLWAFGIEE